MTIKLLIAAICLSLGALLMLVYGPNNAKVVNVTVTCPSGEPAAVETPAPLPQKLPRLKNDFWNQLGR